MATFYIPHFTTALLQSFSGSLDYVCTTQVSRYQKGETNLDLLEQELVSGSDISTLPQTDNYASILPLSFLQARCSSCHPTNSIKALKDYHSNEHVNVDSLSYIMCSINVGMKVPRNENFWENICSWEWKFWELSCFHSREWMFSVWNFCFRKWKSRGVKCPGIIRIYTPWVKKKETLYSCPYLC